MHLYASQVRLVLAGNLRSYTNLGIILLPLQVTTHTQHISITQSPFVIARRYQCIAGKAEMRDYYITRLGRPENDLA